MGSEGEGATGRLSGAVELLTSLAGLAAYITLLGGVREWARMSAAGLPAEHALPALDPGTLVASGLQGVMIAPLAFVAILVALRLGAVLAKRRSSTALAAVESGWSLATQLVIAAVAACYGGLLALLAAVVLAEPAGGPDAGLFAVAAGLAVAVGAAIYGASRAARKLGAGAAAAGTEAADADTLEKDVEQLRHDAVWKGLPGVCRLPAYVVLGTWRLAVAIAVPVVLLGAIAYDLRDDAGWLLSVSLPALIAALTILLLALAGPLWLHVQAGAGTGDGLGRVATVVSVGLVLAALAAAALAPLWIGLYALGFTLLLVLLRPAQEIGEDPSDDPLRRRGVIARAALIAALLAICAVAYEAHSPQTFNRIEIGDGGARVEAALVGDRDEDYVLAVCTRAATGGTPSARSREPTLVRVPRAAAPDAVVTQNGYAFYKETEPSVASAVASLFGWDVFEPRTIQEVFRSEVHDVCGSEDGSLTVEQNRAAIRALTAAATEDGS